jgi:hypothetical protein
MWIDPVNPDHIIDGNDGGLNFSYDRGKTWVDIKMPLGQYYSLALDMDEPFHVYGSLQDSMSWYGSVANIPGVTGPWKRFPGGERSAIAFDVSDYMTLYTTAGLSRIDRKTWSSTNIEPRDFPVELRKNWCPPLIVSPHNPRILYFGSQMLLRSLDRGDHWQAISPDLSQNNPQRYGTVHIQYSTIVSISESPLKFGLIYAGTDDGNIQVTANGGLTWQKIVSGLPADRWVSRIVASQYDERTVYAALNGLRNDDFAAYIYRSTDCGKTWEDIKANLPCGPVNVIREDPQKANILYVGTDLGVYVSLDKGKSWQSLCSNLPTAIVNDLVVHSRDHMLVIGTHGRSAYVVDVNPVQELDAELRQKELHVFSINPLYLVPERAAKQEAPIYYYLRSAGSVSVEISSEAGVRMKTMKVRGEPGINAVFWDLSLDDRSRGASPGRYRVRLVAGDNNAAGTLDIKLPKDN